MGLDAATGRDSVTLIVGLVGLQGIGLGAAQTTTGAAVPRVVPAHLLAAASSLGSLTRYTGAVVGPLLAGVLLPRTGFGPLYLLDAPPRSALGGRSPRVGWRRSSLSC